MAGVLTGCATPVAQPGDNRPVEFWSGGDDGATQQLFVELQTAFAATGRFPLSRGEQPGALVVTIPTHVDALGAKSDRIRYRVDFALRQPDGSAKPLGAVAGRCKLGGCAPRVLKEADRLLFRAV